MKNFIVVQTILSRIDRPNAYTQNNNWDNIIRTVKAKTTEEALGRFIIETQNVKAVEKLSPQIAELDNIITL